MNDETVRRPGKRVVTTVYLIIVVLAGVFGYVIGTISPGQVDPRLFFLIPLPPTPFGMAIYGFVTIAVVLGALLLLVEYVSKKTGTGVE